MFNQQPQSKLANRDLVLQENVHKQLQLRVQKGQLENVEDVFNRLPLPRLEKDHYSFIFQTTKKKIEGILSKQDHVEKIKKHYQQQIDNIILKNNTMLNGWAQQSISAQNEKLLSNRPIFKSLVFIRKQEAFGQSYIMGDPKPFALDDQYIDLTKVKKQITSIKLFLQDFPPLTKINFDFENQNVVRILNKKYPSSYDLQKRAQTLAKIYLLQVFNQEKNKMKSLQIANETEMDKQREISKIKQQMEIEKMKEGELIAETDLMNQVYKILDLLQRKMNNLAYEQFKNENGERATYIKRSLEKLKQNVNEQPTAKLRLKMLIAYKHKKGW